MVVLPAVLLVLSLSWQSWTSCTTSPPVQLARRAHDVLHPESKQQTTPASPRDALECVAALARTRECRQDCVRFAYRGPQVDRLHVLELKRDVE